MEGNGLLELIISEHLPLYIDTNNMELKKLIDKHNLIIKVFWISAITVLPAVIILLNVIND